MKPTPLPDGPSTQKLPWTPFRVPAREWLNADNLPYPRRDEEMRGTFIAREAMQYLEQNRSKRFALWVSFQEPHSPFDFPIEDRGKFNPASFRIDPPGKQDSWQIPTIFEPLSPREKQGIAAAYYTSASFLDRNVGRVLRKLRDLGLEENTLVVYTADHGYCLGQHGRFEKHCGYDPALRVPLILSRPGHIEPGVVRHFTEHIDLGPTLLQMLDAPALPLQHGQALTKARDLIFSEYLENEEVFVRTERWKLIFGSGKRTREDGYVTQTPQPGRYVRLFDLQSDPGEYNDVSGKKSGRCETTGKCGAGTLPGYASRVRQRAFAGGMGVRARVLFEAARQRASGRSATVGHLTEPNAPCRAVPRDRAPAAAGGSAVSATTSSEVPLGCRPLGPCGDGWKRSSPSAPMQYPSAA